MVCRDGSKYCYKKYSFLRLLDGGLRLIRPQKYLIRIHVDAVGHLNCALHQIETGPAKFRGLQGGPASIVR